MNRTPSLFAGVEPLEVFAELLADLDADTGGGEFYDRICEAICRLTTMQRAAIFMAESKGQRVRAVGSHGTRLTELTSLNPSLAETPVAQAALKSDAVVVVSDRIEEAVPADYAAQLGITTLVCTPMSAAGRGYGVICADRGGGRFELSDGERHLLWTLGKLAGLVATARISTRQEERSRRLADRLSLAREIHERVLQRLFGVSLALGAEPGEDERGLRRRCRDELQEAIGDLRRTLERPLAPTPEETGTTLAEALERLTAEAGGRLQVIWQDGLTIPRQLEAPSQSFLAEALRNADKHAEASFIVVEVSADEDTISLLVRNDGVRPGGRGAGMGLRLAAFEALQQGGTVEFGDRPEGEWQARLVLPLGPADA
ncbi:MAG TPA: GAF domain-containing protein [Solirubrobacteraceae bacterium]|nr:GAF domain-containing protein [Solirubrobacteraceae bacterium]